MSTDRNYTDVEHSGARAKAERVGDIIGKPPDNKAVDRDRASKLAYLLEGLEFPATKEEIRIHLNQRSPAIGNRVNDAIEAVENNLDDHRKYDSAYDVEVAAGFVEQAGSKPYVQDKALNRTNRKRIGEKTRPDPYIVREKIWPASARDVSPNTPRGEEV